MKQTNYSNKRVITLLIQFNGLLFKITKLKLKNRQALGLLAEALQINRQILFLLRNRRIGVDFVKQIAVVLISFVKEAVSKWLFRYQFAALKGSHN